MFVYFVLGMAFKPYLVPNSGLPNIFTIIRYKPATDLRATAVKEARYVYKGQQYADLFNAIPFNAPKNEIEVKLRQEEREKFVPYSKNSISHLTEKIMPTKHFPWFTKSASEHDIQCLGYYPRGSNRGKSFRQSTTVLNYNTL